MKAQYILVLNNNHQRSFLYSHACAALLLLARPACCPWHGVRGRHTLAASQLQCNQRRVCRLNVGR